MMSKTPVSVIVPTRNEERALPACLASLAWAAEVVVFDSYSDDGTEAIARGAGAQWVQRRFDDFATHKNWALDHLDLKHEWILIVDADERIPPELAEEIDAIVTSAHTADGYYIARKNIFSGKWLRHADMFPDYNLRLFRRGSCRYEKRIVHEHMICKGAPGYLKTPLVHEEYKSIERYIDRHNVYSSFEAVEAFNFLTGAPPDGGAEAAVVRAESSRRRTLKAFAYRHLPLRSLFVFVWMYIVRLGLLDGRIGLRYCILRAIYEYQIDLKLRELRTVGSPMHEKYASYLHKHPASE